MSGTWTYWKVYAPTAEMDRVVLELADLVERIAGAATSWHVLRYADHSGPHLRFRAFTSPSSADAVHASRHEVGHPVRLDLYEPEVDKWGTNGVRRAEELFTTSTLLAVHAIRERIDVADLLVRHTVSVLVPDQRTRLAVLRTHAAGGWESSRRTAVRSSRASQRSATNPRRTCRTATRAAADCWGASSTASRTRCVMPDRDIHPCTTSTSTCTSR